MMLFSFRVTFIPVLMVAFFISEQALSTLEPETMGNFAKADNPPSPPAALPGPLEPLKKVKAPSSSPPDQAVPVTPDSSKKTAAKKTPAGVKNNTASQPSPSQPMKKQQNNQPPPAKKAKNNTPPPPPSVPIEELNAQSTPPPAAPVPKHNSQTQKKPASQSQKKRHKAPQSSPFNPPGLSAKRRPQNVPPPIVELEEPAEIFDYSAKFIIFYKPCKNQPAPCKHPLITNNKNTMFKYDRNRNINISGIARKKVVKPAPQPDNMGNL